MIEFGQLVEYITESGVYSVPLSAHALDVLPTLAAVKADYAHVATLGRAPVLSAAELDALKANVPYHADVVSNEIVSSDPAVIVDRLISVRERPEWGVGVKCVKADIERTVGVYFNPTDANLYACVQAHTAQADWRPDLPELAALWIRHYVPEAGPQPWVQPYGGSGTYVAGAKVTHKGYLWENIVPGPTLNVWEPGVYGWKNLGPA